MEEFEHTWPGSFHGNLTNQMCISTMAALSQRQAKVDNVTILGTEMICARATALKCNQRNYDINNLMVHEL